MEIDESSYFTIHSFALTTMLGGGGGGEGFNHTRENVHSTADNVLYFFQTLLRLMAAS